jgi:K+-sensing histidine kinase KdpD
MLLSQPDLQSDAREMVSDVRSQVVTMSRMIMNLLDLAKADEGQLSPRREDIALQPLIERTLAEATVQAAARNVRLESRVHAYRVRGDHDLLHRMLANLVENAIRHAPADTAITVSAALRDGATELRIADRGAGVPEQMREKIFSAFVQLEDPDTGVSQRAGRGLGLAFCHVVATCHGGSIWVEDGAPGAVFVIRIPDPAS